MTRKTHIAIGTLACLPFVTSPIGLIGIIGSVAPDYDIKLSMKFHRTFSHSLMFLIFTSFIISIVNAEVGLVWLVGYSSHLILDSLTVSGIPLFWGIKNKRYGLKLFRTGLLVDNIIFLLGMCILFMSLGNMIIDLFSIF